MNIYLFIIPNLWCVVVIRFNVNREFYVMGSLTPFNVDLVFFQFPNNLDFNLSNRPIKISLWNKYDKIWMIATMSLCKSILFDNGVFIVSSAIDMQTKKVLNSTLNNVNMKVFMTLICFNSWLIFKDSECRTNTVNITHHKKIYVLILCSLYYMFSLNTILYTWCKLQYLCLGKEKTKLNLSIPQNPQDNQNPRFLVLDWKTKNLHLNFVNE